jgi:hypothetical protein
MPIALDRASTSSHEWIVDTGAQVHLCADRELFVTLKSEAGGIKEVEGVGGHSVAVKGTGDVIITILQNGRQKLLLICSCLYFPAAGKNLFAPSYFDRAGGSGKLGSGKSMIWKDERLVLSSTLNRTARFLVLVVRTHSSYLQPWRGSCDVYSCPSRRNYGAEEPPVLCSPREVRPRTKRKSEEHIGTIATNP